MGRVARSLILLAALLASPRPAPAQETPMGAQAEAAPGAVRIFLDCAVCDFDFVRRRILFADWVRDRRDADVHVLVTSRGAGAGGTEYVLNFVGRRAFQGFADTLRVTAEETDTQQEVRERLTHALELALTRFVVGTPAGERIRLVYDGPPGERPAPTVPADDPWRSWVFSVGMDGYLSGQESTRSISLGGALGARHTSEAWKVRLSARGSYVEDRFELSENEDFTSTAESFRGSLLVVRSVSDRWSGGLRGAAETSSYSNKARQMHLAAALEYSFFPYQDSSERSLRFQYEVGADQIRYDERTVYGVTHERLLSHEARLTLGLIQPWGSAQFELEGRQLLQHPSQNRASFTLGLDWRVYRGLSLVILGSSSRISDQRSLPAGGVTDEEILLRRRELLTSFDYSVSLGFSYTFGSTYVNVVNPRFDG